MVEHLVWNEPSETLCSNYKEMGEQQASVSFTDTIFLIKITVSG
jgi:hypothetical protein